MRKYGTLRYAGIYCYRGGSSFVELNELGSLCEIIVIHLVIWEFLKRLETSLVSLVWGIFIKCFSEAHYTYISFNWLSIALVMSWITSVSWVVVERPFLNTCCSLRKHRKLCPSIITLPLLVIQAALYWVRDVLKTHSTSHSVYSYLKTTVVHAVFYRHN